MEKLTVWYSVWDGGDGSAYPQFTLSRELAEIHQEIHNDLRGEGWGESCVGSLELESESPIKVTQRLITKKSLAVDLKYYLLGGYYKEEKIKERAREIENRLNDVKDE